MNKTEQIVNTRIINVTENSELLKKAKERDAFKTGLFLLTQETIQKKHSCETLCYVDMCSEPTKSKEFVGLYSIEDVDISDEKCFEHFISNI